MTDTDYKPVAQTSQPTTHQLLKRLTPEIQRALPKGMDADRIARLVMTEIRKNPKLADCTQASFAGALLTASALGLEPGVNGECYLVPYKDNRRQVMDCQLIVGYQGIVKLFWQHPLADHVAAEWVGSNDTFRFVKGLNPILEHTPAKGGERGEPVFYYAIVRAKGREPLWDVFTPEEIKKLRRGKVGTSGDIADPQHWMERKTALKQVLKLAPKSTRLDMALRADEGTGTELSQQFDVPALTESPDYIDGEFDEQHAVEPTPEHDVQMVTEPQTTKLAIIRDERYPKTAKGRADWFKWVATTIGREVDSNTKLTKAEATVLLDVLEPAEDLAQ